jgi:galactokinase
MANAAMTMPSDQDPSSRVRAEFYQAFGYAPEGIFRAPGRVNLIGEHTDYNEGLVMPVAIDRAVWVAAARRPDRQVRLLAANLHLQDTFGLDGLEPNRQTRGEARLSRWSNYARGVFALLERAGFRLDGMDLAYAGDVPMGAGLSSSAAVEVSIAVAARDLSGLHLGDLELARICQQAEREFAGTQCGLMDQIISVAGQEGHALLIDCRYLTWEPLPVPGEAAIVICDTGKRRGLANTAYNKRRAQCEEGARKLGVSSLRDLDVASFEARARDLTPLLRKRCRHVVYENDRTLRASEALRTGPRELPGTGPRELPGTGPRELPGTDSLAAFGQLMNESHASLRDLYEVSCDELDLMAALAQGQPGCWGARMTGAGFGGCVVALVEYGAVDAFVQRVTSLYEAQARRKPAVYVCQASGGAGAVEG